jgi:hypothetical protein
MKRSRLRTTDPVDAVLADASLTANGGPNAEQPEAIMSRFSDLDMDRQRVERLRVCPDRVTRLEYALAEIISISRDNRITQIALRAIDAREVV